MIRLIQSPWVVTLIGGLLYLGTTAAMITPDKFEGVRSDAEASATAKSANNTPSWKFRNPEFDQWVAEVKREKEELALREQKLNELQARLDAERNEISLATQAVLQVQVEFDKNVVRFKNQEMENIKRQAKLISAMSPESAAALLKELPDDEAVRLMFSMKNDEASLILDTLSKMGKDGIKRAAAITSRLGRALPPATGK